MTATAHPPGPKRRPLWGDLWRFRREPLTFLNELHTYGDIVYFYFGPQQVYLLNNPEYIKEVLVNQSRNFVKSRGLQKSKRLLGEGLLTSEGELHKRQRRLVQPAFHRQRIATYASSMVDFATQTRTRWQNGQVIDINQEMMRLTLAIVAQTLFGANVDDEIAEIETAMNAVVHSFNMITLPFSEILQLLPLPSVRQLNRARALLDKTIYRIINERRGQNIDHGDLLSMLLMAQDEEGDGKGMSDKQVRDEAMTLFIAGHETTANALSWTWYLLSQHPEIEKAVYQEIDKVVGDRVPGAEDYPNLRYLQMVFCESMRLYPPAWVFGRRAFTETIVAGYRMPVNSIALMSPYLVQRDERYFPDPLKFDPLRWTTEAQATRPRFSFIPFGGGPRQCIGEPFAMMEGVLLLATIAQKWRLTLLPGHIVEPQPLITLRPKYGIKMTVTERKNQTN
jgi:cytochrome P450